MWGRIEPLVRGAGMKKGLVFVTSPFAPGGG
jgi:hypothetical protein